VDGVERHGYEHTQQTCRDEPSTHRVHHAFHRHAGATASILGQHLELRRREVVNPRVHAGESDEQVRPVQHGDDERHDAQQSAEGQYRRRLPERANDCEQAL